MKPFMKGQEPVAAVCSFLRKPLLFDGASRASIVVELRERTSVALETELHCLTFSR